MIYTKLTQKMKLLCFLILCFPLLEETGNNWFPLVGGVQIKTSVEPQPFNGWWTFGNSTSDEYKSEYNGETAAHYPCDLAPVQCKDLLWCVCYIAIMILLQLMSWRWSCLACSNIGVDAHTCLMSHSHLQHTRGHAKIDIALPEGSQEVRVKSGWQRVASAITERHDSKEDKKMHTAQGVSPKQVINI